MTITSNNHHHRLATLIILITSLTLILSPRTVAGSHTSCQDSTRHAKNGSALEFKLIAIASVLCAGAIGVCIPILGKRYEVLRPENDVFFMIKAFAAGVILATGFIHILPEAFRTLTSPCLDEEPWQKFPFAGFVSMMSAIATLMVDTVASSFYNKVHFSGGKGSVKQVSVGVGDNDGDVDDEEANNRGHHHGVDGVDVHDDDDDDEGHEGHVHVHTHATHGHAHGAAVPSQEGLETSELLRQRVISQVLELGILVHSVIIGVSLGASKSLETIKPLMAALSFHQFFEGIGLGGCISQAKFESMTTTIMMLFFSLTTPIGIGVGIGISSVYEENSPKSLMVEGLFGSASSGILIYMALVDLLAADFMNPRMQSNVRLQLGAYVSLLLGVGCMSFLARWA